MNGADTTFPSGRYDLLAFWLSYGRLLRQLLDSPIETNERTGSRVRVIPGGVSFGVDLGDGMLPTCGLRKTFPRVAAAEIAWYLSGEQDSAWMTAQAPIWDKFVEDLDRLSIDDGGFPFRGEFRGVKAAYGYRWRNHFERDQLRDAIEALKRDPSSRRVLVSAWDPSADGLMEQGQLNVPCPAMFTLSVTEGRLHSTMLLRSSDVFVGLPYDVLGHALLMDAIAVELGVRLGVAQFSLAHAHLYEAHWDMAREAIKQLPVVPRMPMPGWEIEQIEKARDAYVQRVKEETTRHQWPTYSPKPEVIA